MNEHKELAQGIAILFTATWLVLGVALWYITDTNDRIRKIAEKLNDKEDKL